MHLKNILLILLLAIPALSFAQDRIYKTSGEMINGKVLEVNSQSVTYKRADNADGPEYSLNRTEIKEIRYKNGKLEKFNDPNMGLSYTKKATGRNKKKGKVDYHDNILCLLPTAIIADATINEAYGVGLSYERTFAKNGMLGFNVTAIINFYSPYDPTSATAATSTTSSGPLNHTSYYVMPGIKFYPGGSKAKFRYAVGPTLYLAKGMETDRSFYIDANGITQETVKNNNFTTIGALLSNSLNFSPNKSLYFALQLDMGTAFSDNRANGGTGLNNPMLMFAFRAGYRF